MNTRDKTTIKALFSVSGKGAASLPSFLLFGMFALCLAGALSPAAKAQGTAGSLSGTVMDPQGAVIPGAIVNLAASDIGLSRQVVTDSQGRYLFSQLPPASYRVTVEAPGFANYEVKDLVLQVAQQATLNMTLQVKGAVETVTVESGGQMLINTLNAEIGEAIENKRIIELPLNGRQFTQLIALTPGIGMPAGGTSRNDLTGGFDNASFTIHGARETDNYYTVDGVITFDRLFNTVTVMPSVDAIQEFRVQSALYGADKGAQGGGQITLALKSGTSSVRGSAYEYFRNEALDARNFFDYSATKALNRQNQFGGTLGFPIYQNKLFGFGSYEGYRLRRGDSRLVTVPTNAVRQGNLFAYLDANSNGVLDPAEQPAYPAGLPTLTPDELTAWQTQGLLPTRVFNPASLAILNLLPSPNRPGIANNLSASPTRKIDQDQFIARLDWRPNTADSVFARFLFANVSGFQPFGAGALTAPGARTIPGFGSFLTNDSRNLAVGWTRSLSPRLIGTFLFGMNHVEGGQVHQNKGAVGQKIASFFSGVTQNPEYAGIPEVRIDRAGLIDQFGDIRNQLFRNNDDYQLSYDVNYNRGGHNLRAGVQWVHLRFRPDLNNASRGGFNFAGASTIGLGPIATRSGIANFLLGVPEESFGGALATQRFTGNEYAVYLQDDWKLSRRLTLNLGLRYELVGYLNENNLRASVFDIYADRATYPNGRIIVASKGDKTADPSLFVKGNLSGLTFLPMFGARTITVPVVTAAQAGLPEGLMRRDTNNFAPRVGFAIDVFGNARTVIRGGMGLYYSRPTYNTRLLLGFVPPFFNVTDAYNSSSSVNWTTSLTAPITPMTGGELPFTQYPDYKMGLGQVSQASLALQQLLTNDLSLDFEFVGSRGFKLLSDLLFNYRQPAATVPTMSATASRATRDAAKPFPALGGAVVQSDNGDSWYNAGLVKLTKRFSRGTSFFTSYTFSKSLDTDSFGAAPTSASPTGQNPFDKRGDMKGRSDFDVRHRFVFSGVAELPFGKGRRFLNRGGTANALLGGWDATAIVTLQSNSPITAILNSANIDTGKGSGQRPNQVGDPNTGPRTPEQWFNTSALVVQNPAVVSTLTFGNIGRNTLEGPGYKSVDFSLLKNFSLNERMRLQFRSEFFNLFNTVNFSLPNNVIHTGQLLADRTPNPAINRFGTINSARPSRQIQFALRLMF